MGGVRSAVALPPLFGVFNHTAGAFSLNAAMFAAVLLASRLQSNERVCVSRVGVRQTPELTSTFGVQVFVFMLLAVELFAFFPVARWRICCRSKLGHIVVIRDQG